MAISSIGRANTNLTAETINAHNTGDHPEAVKPATFEGMALAGNALLLELPAKSIVVLEIQSSEN